MPLSFLNPALLAGLAAAAVPVIIHFLSRRRLRKIAFSDLRFLRAEEAQQSRRRGSLRWLLLLLRVLLIVLLVLAAARPHWGGLDGGSGRSTLFVVDASASMQAQQPDGRSRFAVAMQHVGTMIGELPPEVSVHVLMAGAQPQPLFATWLPAGPAARTVLEAAQVTDGACDLAAALQVALQLSADAPSRAIDLVLLSDLQRDGLRDLDDAVAGLAAADTRVLVRSLGDDLPGGGVLDVALPGRALRPGEFVEITAVVRPERVDQVFWLEIDGRRIAEAVAPPPPPNGVPVTLAFGVTVPASGLHSGWVGKDPDRFPVDDRRPFVLDVPEQLNVLLVHGSDRDGLGRGGWQYLASALDPAGDASGLFRVRSLAVDSLTATDLTGADLLALVDVGALGRGFASSLFPWLDAGGALLVLAGDPAQDRGFRDGVLAPLGLPRETTWIARPADQSEGARIVDEAHPALAGLGREAIESLAAARWWRYARIDEGDARVVVAAAGGAPLIVEGEHGRGRWMVLPFHLRPDATDVMLNPVFLPLAQRLAARLAEGGRAVAQQPVGTEPTLPVPAERLGLRVGESATSLQLVLPDGQATPIDLRWGRSGPVLVGPPAQRAGVHVFRSESDTLGLVAVTVPATESAPALSPVDDVVAIFAAAGLTAAVDLGTGDATGLARALSGRDLTRWLLVIALGLQALELWLGRRVR